MKAKTKTRANTIPVSEYRFDGGSRMVAGNGEIQASSKRDLLQQQVRLMAAVANGQTVTDSEYSAAERTAMVAAAFNDSAVHRQLGERVTANINMTSNRKGYARRFLARNELKQGDIPRFRVQTKNVQAFVATGPTKVETQIVRDKYLMPPEVQVVVRPFIPINDLNQGTGDILNDKYVEGLEGTMVVEDRMWYNMSKQAIGLANNQTIISGTLTPASLMGVVNNVTRWGLKAAHMLMATDINNDIIGDAMFIAAIEPVARHELVMTGQIAVLYGLSLISDQYRHPEHKVISQGEFVIVSDPLTHGAYSDRGGADSSPIDVTTEGVVGRGWVIHESIAMAVGNDRSVAFGRRM